MLRRRTAIVRGAVLRGLDGSIVRERRARRNYGCTASISYEEALAQNGPRGLENHTHFNPVMGELQVEGNMTWFIKKASVSYSFHTDYN
jgi:hypothetical protein